MWKATGNHHTIFFLFMPIMMSPINFEDSGVIASRSESPEGSDFYKFSLKIGTWNVKTLLKAGKLENAKEEIKKNSLDILRIAEMRWVGTACEYYKRFNRIFQKSKYWKPSCLPDGTFAPKQCKGEKMSGKCYCVDKMGVRIFGEEEWTKAENMTCACSRLANEAKETGLERTIHCDHLGNFEPLQCNTKVCWCANPKTGIPYTNMVPMEMIVSLPCYNRNEAGIQYFRQCDSENNMQENIRSLLWNHGTKKITLTKINCNYDGSYHRVQIVKSNTRCVSINNSPLTEAVESDYTNCNCAFDRHIAQQNQAEFIMDCLPNGNYRRRQAWSGKVYCVDDDGFYYSDDPDDCPKEGGWSG